MKVMQKDALYILVVNLPSQEEVQESVRQLEHIMSEAGVTDPPS